MMNSRLLFAATLVVALLGGVALTGQPGVAGEAFLNRAEVAQALAQDLAQGSFARHASYEVGARGGERSAGSQ